MFSAPLDWLWSVARMTKERHCETQILRMTSRPGVRAGEDQMEEVESSDDGGKYWKKLKDNGLG